MSTELHASASSVLITPESQTSRSVTARCVSKIVLTRSLIAWSNTLKHLLESAAVNAREPVGEMNKICRLAAAI
jgi:hypothetical protein